MSASLNVGTAREAKRRVDRMTAVIFIGLFASFAGCLLVSTVLDVPPAVVVALPGLLFCVWVINSPEIGLYTLFGAALLFAVQPLTFATSITDLPFFVNLPGPGVTPAEILIFATLVGVIGRVATNRRESLGRLIWPYLAYGGAVVVGEINGLFHGGDFRLSLWEIRPQVYGLIIFTIATVLLRDRAQLKILLVILLIAEAFKAADGLYRYFVVLDPQMAAMLETNQAHEDSYLLGLFVLAAAVGFIWLRRPIIVLLFALSPLVFLAITVNHRRAGELGLGFEIALVMVLGFIMEPRMRRGILIAAILLGGMAGAFLVTFWNHDTGTIGQLVRPVKSLFDPSIRDQASDQYRINEAHNLKATYRTSPLLGIGFGHPYYIYWAQIGASKVDPLWNLIPHNNILWIPMRMGVLGLVTFWGLISAAIAEGVWVMRNLNDAFLRGAIVFALAAMVGVLFIGYVDIGLESYRNMIVLGVMLAVINRAAALGRLEPARVTSSQTAGVAVSGR
jgi:O-Antigen ligase